MANEAGLKIVVGSDVSGALAGLNSVSAAAAKAGVATEQSFAGASVAAVSLANSLESTSSSFDEVAASSKALAAVDAALENMAQSAIEAKRELLDLGNARLPLSSISEFQARVAQLKADIKTGFVSKIEVTGGASLESLSLQSRTAITSIASLEDKIKKLNAELRISTDPASIARLNKEIKITEGSIASLKKYTDASSNVFKQLTPGANSASLALTNVGRVAQDLPFGFIGIQNNLNPLLESFQRLKAETGSTGSALKALGGSLIGAGGIGLALSVISSAFLIYQNGIAGFNKKTKEAAVELEGFSKSLQEANAKAGDELARLKILTTVAQDNTRSTKDRMDAVVALQKEMPETFKQLDKEKILNGDLRPAIEATTQAIIDRAKARAIESRLSALSAKDLDLDIKREEIARNLLTAQNELARSRKYQDVRGAVADVGAASYGAEQKVTNLKDALLEVNLQSIGVGEEILRLGNRIKNEDLKIDTGLGDKTSTKKGKTAEELARDQLAKLKDELDGYQKQLAVTNKLREAGVLPIYRENDALELQLTILDKIKEIDTFEVKNKLKVRSDIDLELNELEISKAYEEAAKRLSLKPTIPISAIIQLKPDTQLAIPDNIIPDNAFDAVINKMRSQGKIAAENIGDIGNEIKDAINGALANTAEAIGVGFGDLLSGLGGASLISGFANVLADLLTTVGKMLIKTGIQILGLQKLVLTITTPAGAAAAIAGGIAAIALAQLLKNQIKDIKPRPFATGGLVNAPTLGLIGEAGPEVVLPLDRIPGLLNSAGGGNVNLTGKLAISGRELVAFINREDRAFNRING